MKKYIITGILVAVTGRTLYMLDQDHTEISWVRWSVEELRARNLDFTRRVKVLEDKIEK